MHKQLIISFLGVINRISSLRLICSRSPSGLLYHGVPKRGINDNDINADVFEEQIIFMKKRFQFIRQNEVSHKRSRDQRIQVLLTFDDGFRNNADVVAPILKRHQIPATFFVCSRHSISNKYLWFVHLKMLKTKFNKDGFLFRGEYIDMRPDKRNVSIEKLRHFLVNLKPHPGEMYRVIEEELPPLEDFLSKEEIDDWCTGMTEEQIGELSRDGLFEIGVHTNDHALLSKCDYMEKVRQITENKLLIEKICQKKCETISYPTGDYDHETLELCKDLNLSVGYAVYKTLRTHPNLEIPRIGIYNKSLDILNFKTVFCNHLRKRNIVIG
jgi:peptidoglycan/xylan/chitin deacetylase (PgdA/CDA1 family)